jgi:hypothetical protein
MIANLSISCHGPQPPHHHYLHPCDEAAFICCTLLPVQGSSLQRHVSPWYNPNGLIVQHVVQLQWSQSLHHAARNAGQKSAVILTELGSVCSRGWRDELLYSQETTLGTSNASKTGIRCLGVVMRIQMGSKGVHALFERHELKHAQSGKRTRINEYTSLRELYYWALPLLFTKSWRYM